MSEPSVEKSPVLLGFDPGRDKCGVAIRSADGQFPFHQVIPAADALQQIPSLCQHWQVTQVVMGNQTTAQQWLETLRDALPNLPIALVDERYTTLEARDRYWQLYPPTGLRNLIPQSLRQIPRPIDDIVAMLLIERYLTPPSP